MTANAFFVAANGNDSWSGRLDAPNAAGTDGPFASLERARAAMRASDVKTTYVREGTYRLSGSLELTAADSGVRIAAYPGETPVISGGERVTGFVSEGNGLYSAAVSRPTSLDLVIGGVRQKVAQSGDWNAGDPRSGWLVLDQAVAGPSTTAIRYHQGEVDPALLQAGLKIQTFSTDRLTDGIVDVAGIDAASQTISFRQAVQEAPKTGGTYRLLNAPALIRDAGEFAWRAADGHLVVKPQDSATLLGQGAVVPRLGTLVALNGASQVTLSGLSFADGTWDGAALTLSGGAGNSITGNHFTNVGTAIRLTGSSGNAITGNWLEHLGATGVELAYGSNANLIDSNSITDIGLVSKYVGGVMAYGVANNVVSHNAISGSPRYGISFKNWNAATVNTDNRILYNRITDTGRETADTGGIEILGRTDTDTRTTIIGNWIDGVGGLATDGSGAWITGHKSFGLYLDDQTNGATVRDNFIRGTGWASVFIHGGDDNDVENNIAILANPGERFLRLEWQPVAGDAGTPRNNTIVRNIIQSTTGADYWTLFTPGNFQLDDNLVSGTRRYGADDRIGDPGFVDAAAGNFHLGAGSAAAALGIHDLDWAQMSLAGASPQPPEVLPSVPSAPVVVPTPPAPVPPATPSGTPTTPAAPTTLLNRIVGGVVEKAVAQAYVGPVTTLQWQYLGDGRGEVVGGSDGNDFLNLLGGDDAAAGGAGDDVLDGGSGSNWLIGGSGTDTFFVDGRNPEPTWSTVTDLERNEWTTLWGFQQGISRLTWEEMSGAEGYKGATARCDIDGNGSIDASVTFAGHAASEMLTTASSVNGTPYLAFIKL